MVRPSTVCFVARLGIGGALLGMVACSETAEERLQPPPGFAARPSASSHAAEEGYYRRYFGELDDNDDGRLSRAELEPEAPDTPEVEVADEELVDATEQEYLDERLRRYDLRADPSVGMMSTKDFDEMIGGSGAAIGGSRPGFMP